MNYEDLPPFIPVNFDLAGLKIMVESCEGLMKNQAAIGHAVYDAEKIIMDYTAGLKNSSMEQSFLHEMTHWILFVMNEHDLRNNEKFVDLFSHFLYQALKSGGFYLANELQYDLTICQAEIKALNETVAQLRNGRSALFEERNMWMARALEAEEKLHVLTQDKEEGSE